VTSEDTNEEREKRIRREIVVDAYTPEEQVMGWYAYLEDVMDFPFEAQCVGERDVSPLEEGETVSVLGMTSTDASSRGMFVTVSWMDRELGVPLTQLEPIEVDEKTAEAIADWHYWSE